MTAGVIYGLVGGLVFIVLESHPAGSFVYWGFVAMQSAWATPRIWRKTGLPFVATAGILATISSTLMAVASIYGYRVATLPIELATPFFIMSGLIVVCMLLEPRVHPNEWDLWKKFAADKTLWEVLTLRSVPHLRPQRTNET